MGMVVGFMHPQSRGTVTLRSKDSVDAPVLNPQFLEHPFDRRAAIEIVREAIKFLNTTAVEKHHVEFVYGPKGDTDEEILVSSELCRLGFGLYLKRR